jgi:uncharacterized protein YlxW (UPF0749 family)
LGDKIRSVETNRQEKTQLQTLIDDLTAEVELLKTQKNEKDSKLKNQIKKNEELLGELQQLSEAVNVVKNKQELSMTA